MILVLSLLILNPTEAVGAPKHWFFACIWLKECKKTYSKYSELFLLNASSFAVDSLFRYLVNNQKKQEL